MPHKLTIEGVLEEFDKKFTHREMWGDEALVLLNEGSPREIKSFIRTKYEALIGEIIKELEISKGKIGTVVIFDRKGAITEGYDEAISLLQSKIIK